MVKKKSVVKKLLSWCLILNMILLSMPAISFASNPTVAILERDNGAGGILPLEYDNLQDALDGAHDGETVRILAGTLTGQFIVKTNITLIGAGRDLTVLSSPDTALLVNSNKDLLTNNGRHRVPVLEIQVANANTGMVTIKDLTIDGRGQGFESDAINGGIGLDREFIGIAAVDTNAVIDNVVVKNIAPESDTANWRFKNYGILAEGSNALAAPVTVTVKNSLIQKFQEIGILVWGPKLHAIITNNTVIGEPINGVANNAPTYWAILAQRGIQIGGNNAINPGNNFATVAGTTAVVSGNSVQNIGTGGPYTPSLINLWSAGAVEVSNNVLVGCADPIAFKAAGMNLEAQGTTANIHDNTLTSLFRGIKISAKSSASGIHPDTYDYGNHTLTNNQMSAVETAVYDTSSGNDDINNTTIALNSVAGVGNTKTYQDYVLYDGNDSFTDTGLAPTRVDGGKGNDIISTGGGNDTLYGGEGVDTLTGGAGSDVFLYESNMSSGVDTITDFQVGDTLRVLGADFTGKTVTEGDGSHMAAGSVQVLPQSNMGRTILSIDTYNNGGIAEFEVVLTGVFQASQFTLNGTDISLKTAPTITGPTVMELTRGYSTTSTGVYTITGTAPVTVTKLSGNAAITWNDTTKKIDIAAGLAIGNYPVVLKASNGALLDSTLNFTLTVKNEDITVPGAPTGVSAVAGNGQATVRFSAPVSNGGSPITSYTVVSSPGGITATGSGTTIVIPGLTNGIGYTFTVKAINAAGGGAFSSPSSIVTPYVPSNDSYSPYTPASTANTNTSTNTGVDILVNGKVENAGVATSSTKGAQTVTTVAVDEKKIESKLASEGIGAVITIPVNSKADVVVGELNGQMIKNMESKSAILEVKTSTAAYTLPAKEINIDAISKQVGTKVSLQDIKVQIEISKATEQGVAQVEKSAKQGEFTVVAPPVTFDIRCNYAGQTIEVQNFNAYIQRMIAIPDGVDPNKITTGVVVEADGTSRHVPTKVTVVDGKYYAVINSLTNSLYSVVWHPMTFNDVNSHWAKDSINDMGSRMVITGIGNGTFEPSREITRAEFAAIMVKALGLKPGMGINPFSDVKSSDWYSDYVRTAVEYKLISGYGDGKFGPTDKITREQVMTMISNAMKLTALDAGLSTESKKALLVGFRDSIQVSSYAQDAVAACVKLGIASGKDGKRLAPKDEITRAEVAVMIRQLLLKSKLI